MTVAGLLCAAGLAASGAAQDGEAELAPKVAAVDAAALKAFAGLSRRFREEKAPDVAHFFAECHAALGGADPVLDRVRAEAERELYQVGLPDAATPLRSLAAIDAALRAPAAAYAKLAEPILARVGRPEPPPVGIAFLRNLLVRRELASQAGLYARALRGINGLRAGMGLKPLLWDGTSSSAFIPLLALQTSQDLEEELRRFQEQPGAGGFAFWSKMTPPAAEPAAMLFADLPASIDRLRSLAGVRGELLNPDGRRLWLARGGGRDRMTVYHVARGAFREDVPTPSKHYGGPAKTDGWIETEKVFTAGGRRVPWAHYPFDGEKGAPRAYAQGVLREERWAGPGDPGLAAAGLPIELRFFADVEVKGLEAELRDPQGRTVPAEVILLGPGLPALARETPGVLLLPRRPLAGLTAYTAQVRAEVGGAAFQASWTFTTSRD